MITINANLDLNQGEILTTIKVMINEYICYKCKCEKCSREWITKTHDVPRVCPKCHSVKWNEGAEPATRSETLQAPQIIAPIDDKQARLEAARAALMSVESKVFSPVIETEPEWQFTEEPTWYDDTNTPYRRQWIQTGARPTYRNVEVGEFDHNEVVRVK